MQSQRFKVTVCRLCFNVISDTNREVIDEDITDVLEVVLPNLNIEDRNKHVMCKSCLKKLYATFNFKSTCMDTEDIISTYLNSSKMSVVDLKEVYLKEKGNIQLTDTSENQKICRLCIQLVTHGFVSLKEVDADIIDTYVPIVNFCVTKDPVICGPCFDSLCTHGDFLKKCLNTQEKYKSDDDKQSYIKSEEIELKLEDGQEEQKNYQSVKIESYIKYEGSKIKLEEDSQDLQERYKSLEQQFCIKLEKTEVKVEQGDQDSDSCSYGLAIENKMRGSSGDREEVKNEYMPERETGSGQNITMLMNCSVQIQKSEKIEFQNCVSSLDTELYQCDKCKYESKFKVNLKKHQLVHKDLSEVKSFKCDKCSYKTKRKSDLNKHHLSHRNPSEIQMYKCDACTYESRYKSGLKVHQLKYQEIIEIQIYKCDTCTYETKHKSNLKLHWLSHKDPSEIQMYKCDICNYETMVKSSLQSHQLIHKDSSEIQMYKCEACAYETRQKRHLKVHQLTHKDRSEVHMYKSEACMFETKRKSHLKQHQLRHKDPSDIHMYKCDTCSYGTKYKYSLMRHRLKHKNISEIQTYKCDICDHVTKYKDRLKNHQLTHKNLPRQEGM